MTLLLDVHAFVRLAAGVHAATHEVVGVLRARVQAKFAGAGVERSDDGPVALFIHDFDFEGFRNRGMDAPARDIGFDHLRLCTAVAVAVSIAVALAFTFAVAVTIFAIFEPLVNEIASHRQDERLGASPPD